MEQLLEATRSMESSSYHQSPAAQQELTDASKSLNGDEYIDVEDYVDVVGEQALMILSHVRESLTNLKGHIHRTEKSPENSDASLLGNPIQWQAWCYVYLGCEEGKMKQDIAATLKRWLALPVRFMDNPGMAVSVTGLYTRDLHLLCEALGNMPFPRSVQMFNAMVQVKPLPLARDDAKLIIPAALRAAEKQRWSCVREDDGLELKKEPSFNTALFTESLVKWLTPYNAHSRYVTALPDRSNFPDTATFLLDTEVVLDEIYDAEAQYPTNGSNRRSNEKLTISDVFF